MLFQTPLFFAFFAIFFGLYYLTRKSLRLQNILILIGSYIFYGAWDERFLVLIIASTATDYLAGLGAAGNRITNRQVGTALGYLFVGSLVALAAQWETSGQYFWAVLGLGGILVGIEMLSRRMSDAARRKFYVTSSVVINLSILGVFKYLNFFAESLVALGDTFGIGFNYVTLEIVLPVGISFYTFQTLSYTIDAYRGNLKPTDRFIELAAFVAFFPQLVAGPVERAAHLLPQFDRLRHLNWENIQTGLALFAWGMFKKVVIADNIAPIADQAFTDPSLMTAGQLFAGLLAFTFQIYCDFSGYSDMARGSARMLGFDLMLNFNLPYVSRTPSEFWRRWHISLSSWLRDYLYISLGGNRGGAVSTYRNLSLTMILGGLWHGASWTFVLWGTYHGLLLVIYRIFNIDDWLEGFKNRAMMSRVAINGLLMAIMFGFTLIGWLIFRANDMASLGTYFVGLFGAEGWTDPSIVRVLSYIAPLVLVQIIQFRMRDLEFFWRMPKFIRLNLALAVLYGLLFLPALQTQAFIYFDF
ncbi:MBOAT family O-acyltransferase [Pseudokordiimonas caeni]|uniref:MBOAT family O-acyltransferase n=1 Tax=Pseudokordiimonas caeni TaxID=2997908 RepID=UPI0028112D32|nr:MBOAT family O-acyltransferase [Pseudokordiimonas caeni]